MGFFTPSPSSPEHFSDIPIRTPYPFQPLITSVHLWHRSTSGTRSTIIPRVFSPRGCPFQVGLSPFAQTLYCLLMWDAGRSTIAMPWNGGSVPPIQRGHCSLSFLFSILLLFFNLTPCVRATGTFLVHPGGTREGLFSFVMELLSCPIAHGPTSTTMLPIYEDQPQSGSLFASRTLPPLRLLPHLRPQPFPLLRSIEWSSLYQRDSEGHLCHFCPREDNRPLYRILPSPLATSSSEDNQNQRQVALHSAYL